MTAAWPWRNSMMYMVISPSVMSPRTASDRAPRIGAVQRGDAHERERKTPGVAADGEIAILLVQPFVDRLVPAEEEFAEVEQLDLLGMVLARERGLEITLHARLGRAPAEQAERVAGELGLGEERRQAAEDEHDHGPGREPGEQHREAGDGDGVLEQARGAHDQRQRPARRFAARARELVVELGILEVRELERQRLLEDQHVDAIRKLGLEQRVGRT